MEVGTALQFFLPGLARVRSKGAIRIYNKIGRAYGFTIDNAYVNLPSPSPQARTPLHNVPTMSST